ncbi:hypothetical protein ABFA25_02635 [Mycobacterium lepromatosis]|uniref:hypothetical protein n=1 Tax=Mycobacterium lepromatosis TaxID=480418 RepID=UPI003D801D35
MAAVVGFGHRVMILLLNSPQDLAPLLAANILGSHCGRAELPVHFGLDRRPARGVRITVMFAEAVLAPGVTAVRDIQPVLSNDCLHRWLL